MEKQPLFSLAILAGFGALVMLAACGMGSSRPDSTCPPSAPANEIDAVRIATSAANSLIGGQAVLQERAERTSTCRWLVTLVGRFYEPPGPAGPATTADEPRCSAITVRLSNVSSRAEQLSMEPIDDC
jgi:hypothetical protein